MHDRQGISSPGFSVQSLAPAERDSAREFLALYAEVRSTLRSVDLLLAAIPADASAEDFAAAARSLDLPWGGHPAGLYLAGAIERTSGRAALTSTMLNPWRFLAAYQDAARRSQGLSFFS